MSHFIDWTFHWLLDHPYQLKRIGKQMEIESKSLRKNRFIPRHAVTITTSTIVFFTLAVLAVPATQAQTYTVLHFFDGPDGQFPVGALTFDGTGALFGTTYAGGQYNQGTLFDLLREGSGWLFIPGYDFTGDSDGGAPFAGVAFGTNGYGPFAIASSGGAGYGTIYYLGGQVITCRIVLGCSVFPLRLIHTFAGPPSDGANPAYGTLVFDQSGNLYGTASSGGEYNTGGVVFKLTPSGNGYTETILHNFGNGTDGVNPASGVIFDSAGNLYGTALLGGAGSGCGTTGCGVIYQLVPSNGGWTENIVFDFAASTSGNSPDGTLIMDRSGNLYGTTAYGGPGGNGTVFELLNGSWNYSLLYSFSATCVSRAGVTMDSAGNLYGVCYEGGVYEHGFLFKLTKSQGIWTLSDLHDFDPINYVDGQYPWGPVTLDANGNVYGTTAYGGINGNGIVWEYTP